MNSGDGRSMMWMTVAVFNLGSDSILSSYLLCHLAELPQTPQLLSEQINGAISARLELMNRMKEGFNRSRHSGLPIKNCSRQRN